MKKNLFIFSSVDPRTSNPESRRGVTLVELLAVVAILVILAGFLFPALNRVRGRAHQVVCIVHLRQLSLAVRAYADDFGGPLPSNLYGDTIAAYYRDQTGLVLCPADNTDFTLPGSPRGSFGINSALTSYKLTNLPEKDSATGKPIPVVGDSTAESLNVTTFSDRHRGRGNIAFIDGHVESKTVSEAKAYF